MNEMQDYFDDLLREAVKETAEPTVIVKEKDHKTLLAQLQKQKLQSLLDQQKTMAQSQTKVDSNITPLTDLKNNIPLTGIEGQTTSAVQSKTEVQVPDLLTWKENGRPVWAQEAFDVLLFTVSGLTLAVPLIALGQIQKIDDKLTPLFGQSDWFMGLLDSPQGNIKTVNTALFVMPERYNAKFLETAQFVVSIDGLKWGLAVDSVNQPTRVHPDEVKWRGNRSKRPWLAGTVKAAMCALIDIPQMGKILSESEK